MIRLARRSQLPRGVAAHAVAVALCVGGCADPPQRPVVVRFAAGVAADQVTLVELSLIEGGCGLQPVELGGEPQAPLRTARARRSGGSVSLGEIETGRHYVYGRAFTEGCDVIAAGCASTDVARDAEDTVGELQLQLEPVPGPRCGSGCDELCRPVAPACGDGVLQLELCDDGNREAGDGCDSGCAVERGFECVEAEPSQCRPSG